MPTVMSPRLEQVKVNRATYAANLPLLAVKYNRAGRPGERMDLQQHGATIQIIKDDAAADDKLRVVLKEKYADVNGDVVAGETKTYNLDGEVLLTLGALVDAINAIPGFTAWALHAPHAFSINAATFVDAAEAPVSEGDKASEVLQRSVATANKVYLRIGEPEVRDTGRMRLVRVEGSIATATGGAFKLWRDEKGKDAEVILEAAVAAAGVNVPFDYTRENAPTYQGPLVVEVGATNSTGLDYRVHTMQASY